MYRIGRIAALVACIMHALVLPALSASMKAAQAASTELARASTIICHTVDATDMAGATAVAAGISSATSSAPAPASDNSGKDAADDCQICKGLAAIQLAVLVSVVLGLVEPPMPAVFSRPEPVDAASLASIAIRNRGPPSLV